MRFQAAFRKQNAWATRIRPTKAKGVLQKRKPHLFYPFRHLADTRCLPFSGCLRITHFMAV